MKFHQLIDSVIAVDSPDPLDLCLRDRLFVSDNRERFEKHIGKPRLFRSQLQNDELGIIILTGAHLPAIFNADYIRPVFLAVPAPGQGGRI